MPNTRHLTGKAMAIIAVLGLSACGAPSVKTVPGSVNWSARYGEFYERNWGVEIIGVRRVSSGYLLEFRYRVVDAEKAKALSDKTAKPYLHDEASGATLAVPALEKVGEIRQSAKSETDRIYYMIFGNPGQLVKPGNRVSVVIGKFRVDGLIVQ